MIRFTPLLLTLIVVAVFTGCSSDSLSTQIPSLSDDANISDFSVSDTRDNRTLTGSYTIMIDPVLLTAQIIPDREIMAHINVTGWVPYNILVNSYDGSSGIVDLDFTIQNQSSFSAHDVRLIVFQNNGHKLLNADNWTDLYDPPGGLPINPFKAYSKSEPGRIFSAHTEQTENLQIFIPSGNFNVGFAIDASWPTNCAEPYSIENFFQGYLWDQTGAEASVYVDVLDWQDNINAVYLYCPQVTGQQIIPFSYLEENTYRLTLTNSTGAVEGEYSGAVIAYSDGNPIYQVIDIEVLREKTIGNIFKDRDSFEGYTLIAPLKSSDIWLIDMDGRIVNHWPGDVSYRTVAQLLENGNILTLVDVMGKTIHEYDWDGNILWNYTIPSTSIVMHHDLELLPNGNVLAIAWDYIPKAEAYAAGRNNGTISGSSLLCCAIYEIEPVKPSSGNIVWEWHSFNHLSSVNGGTAEGEPVSTDITDPGLLNINFPLMYNDDWLHCNAVHYNPQFDQIMVSNHNFGEVFIIDHSTVDYDNPQLGIAAAKGPAGDIVYRWGNPRAYGEGTISDQILANQHDCQWITPGLPGEGNILVFNNGKIMSASSSLVEFIPPVDDYGNYTYVPGQAYGPASPIWTYTANPPQSFYSSAISGLQRLANANTLACEGNSGRFFELNPDNEIVWEYINPVTFNGREHQGHHISSGNTVFRSYRYAPDYPAFDGRDMTPGDYVELPRL